MTFKDLRLNAKVNQVGLALRLGVDQTTVSKWETGRAVPRSRMIKKIAQLLNTTAADILDSFSEGK